MIVINFLGAPCAGKSTAASGLFNIMKRHGEKVEYVTEVAKDYIYSGSSHRLKDQLMILAEQNHKIERLCDKNIDFAVTDAPTIFSAFYGKDDYPESFQALSLDLFNKYPNINIYIHRNHSFNNLGRIHDEKESMKIDLNMRNFLINNSISFVEVASNNATPENLYDYVKVFLKEMEEQLIEEELLLKSDTNQISEKKENIDNKNDDVEDKKE